MEELSLFFANERSQTEASEQFSSRCNPLDGKTIKNVNESINNRIGLLPEFLPPENDEGFIEYKRELISPSVDRIQHLITQLKYRLGEGKGTAIYRLGVDDNGTINGLSPSELALSVDTLLYMASTLNAKIHLISQRIIDKRRALELSIKELPPCNKGNADLFVAMLGGIDVGKTTLLGVLSNGELDNGFGKARLNLFHHRHEVLTGRTSCCSSALIGFDKNNSIVNYTFQNGLPKKRSPLEIDTLSDRVVTLFDLAGHPKYQKTMLAGLTRCQPSFVIIVISATSYFSEDDSSQNSNHSEIFSSKQLLDYVHLVIMLGIKFAIVLTKIDRVPSDMVATIKSKVHEQLNDLSMSMPHKHLKNFDWPPAVFTVSAVTGVGLDSIIECLSHLGTEDKYHIVDNGVSLHNLIASMPKHPSYPIVKFLVTKVFTKVSGVNGPIIVGNLITGSISVGQQLWIGPDQAGNFCLIDIIGLHRNRQPHEIILAGQRASIAYQLSDRVYSNKTFTQTLFQNMLKPRRGMLIISRHPHIKENTSLVDSFNQNTKTKSKTKCGVCWQIAVNRLTMLPFGMKPSTVTNKCQTVHLNQPIINLNVTIFCNNICQTGIIAPCTSTNSDEERKTTKKERSLLRIRFTKQPEFLEVGQQVIISWSPSSAKAIGYIAAIEDVLSYFPCTSSQNESTCQNKLCSMELAKDPNDISLSMEEGGLSLPLKSNELSDINTIASRHKSCLKDSKNIWRNLQSHTCSLLQMIGLDQSDIENDINEDYEGVNSRSAKRGNPRNKPHQRIPKPEIRNLISSNRIKSAIFTDEMFNYSQSEDDKEVTSDKSKECSSLSKTHPQDDSMDTSVQSNDQSLDLTDELKPAKKKRNRKRNHNKVLKKDTL